MEEEVFDSISSIDEKLDEEFGKVATEPEETPNDDVETTSTDVENNEEQNEEENTEEEIEVPQKPQDNEGKSKDKKEHAFAQLRSENGTLKQERDNYKADSDYLKELAASYGYDDVTKFQKAIREAKYQREAETNGYDPVLYKKTMEQEERIAQLEREREQEAQERKIERFQNALDNAVKTYNISSDEIFERLESSGIPADEILNSSNPKLILDGVLIDKIQNSAKQKQIEDLQNLKDLAEDNNEPMGNEDKITIDDLLKNDIAKYKKDNFYE